MSYFVMCHSFIMFYVLAGRYFGAVAKKSRTETSYDLIGAAHGGTVPADTCTCAYTLAPSLQTGINHVVYRYVTLCNVLYSAPCV